MPVLHICQGSVHNIYFWRSQIKLFSKILIKLFKLKIFPFRLQSLEKIILSDQQHPNLIIFNYFLLRNRLNFKLLLGSPFSWICPISIDMDIIILMYY